MLSKQCIIVLGTYIEADLYIDLLSQNYQKGYTMKTEQTLEAVKQAFKVLQENLVDDSGHLALSENFFEELDELLEKFQETKALAEAMR